MKRNLIKLLETKMSRIYNTSNLNPFIQMRKILIVLQHLGVKQTVDAGIKRDPLQS